MSIYKDYDLEHNYVGDKVGVLYNGDVLSGVIVGVQPDMFSGVAEYLIQLQQGTEMFVHADNLVFYEDEDEDEMDKGFEEC